MKTLGKLALGAVSMLTAAGSLLVAGPAVAAAPAAEVAPQVQVFTAAAGVAPPAQLIGPNGEKPTEWGVASFDMLRSGSPVAKASVGGGTWLSGTTAALTGKTCYSNYIHPTKKHSASIAFAGGTKKDIRRKDVWAKAKITAGAAYTCNTYWGVY
ncbi:lactococcin 972 family bacteriocin [Streptomyces sp. JUS-F4]|uniref:lactococcin 972 family bacteriocin n=1 Tax=Streptomyces TaxID=1883 RepID=UPI00067CCF6C|nr:MULTISPECIES: lactococcin 972 family bacteriocin [Streptomyces]WKN12760.1 lactococcin 972 family bacteriocin [Streptomyces sp. JUS-F4]